MHARIVPAGIGILGAGALMLAASTRAVLPVRETVLVPLFVQGWTLVSAVMLLGAVLALVRGAGSALSRGGRIALILWAAGPLAHLGTALLPTPDGSLLVIASYSALQLGLAAAGVIGACATARARVPPGLPRWFLLPTTVVQALLAVITAIPLPIPIEVIGPLFGPLDLVREVLLMLAGAVLAVTGRSRSRIAALEQTQV